MSDAPHVPQTPQPYRTPAIAAFVLLFVAAAFALGMGVATWLSGWDGFENDMPAEEIVVDDGLDGTTEEVVNDASSDTDAAPGDIVVDWYAVSDQSPTEFNFYLRRWWEAAYPAEVVPVNSYAATVLGAIQTGQEYDGYYVVQATVDAGMDLGSSATTFYILEQQKQDTEPVVLTRYAVREPSFGPFANPDEFIFQGTDTTGLTLSSATIDGMDLAATLAASDRNAEFVWLGSGVIVSDRAAVMNAYPVTVTTDSGVRLREFTERIDGISMSASLNEFFTVLPNGRVAWYRLDLPLWDEAGAAVQVPSIVWNDRSTVGEYTPGVATGCGFSTLTNVVTEMPTLEKSGSVLGFSDQYIWTPTDHADPLLADYYASWQWMQQAQSTTADTSIAAFAATKPVFYYQDVLGRWLKVIKSDVIPAGECGKPVIYLYPEVTTDITVQLAPQGGFTKTEPAYGNGWNVTASPNGSLVNHADGATYPYLFWEGRGGLYDAPKNYWVVARAEVPTFLQKTLTKLGLNAQEIADFNEFWLPRMTSAPYYKIGFHGTSVMNAIAPMTLSTPPDTLIRILMDYSELAVPEAGNPPMLPATPVRKGFTVTEWGGVIR